jgi:hypothetical protein
MVSMHQALDRRLLTLGRLPVTPGLNPRFGLLQGGVLYHCSPPKEGQQVAQVADLAPRIDVEHVVAQRRRLPMSVMSQCRAGCRYGGGGLGG